MSKLVLLAALAGALLALLNPPQSPAPVVAITQITIIDPAGGPSRPEMTVLLSGDRIATVGPSATVQVPAGARVIDGRGKYVIPGLWDMHVHLSYLPAEALPLFLVSGVLGVREMGGEVERIFEWREQVAAGRLLGPRIVAPGPVVESPAWLALLRERASDLPGARELLRVRIGVGTAEDAQQAVDSAAAMGADFIKFRNNASRESYFALAREARRQKLPLAGHAPHSMSPEEASDSGHASFEHGFLPALDGMTPADRAALFRRFRANGSAVTPTLIAGRNHRLLPDSLILAALADSLGVRDPRMRYVPARLRAKWREEWELTKRDRPRDWAALQRSHLRDVGEMQREGVRILAGTDFGVQFVHPGWSLHEELELLVTEAGLSPQEALRSATLSAAEFLGLQHTLGTVEAGKSAELVILDADPLQDIRNTQRVHTVIRRGQVHDRAALNRMLAQVHAAVRR
jgi:imidazolonepropionase-like amidohydrolase